MSFFSDLFSGNFGNLGSDLAPSNIFKDTVSSFENQPGWLQGLEIGGAAALGAGAALPALGAAVIPDFGMAVGEAAGGGFADLAGGAGAAAGAGGLSGLTEGDVSFLDPTLLGEASAPGAVPPPPPDF